jgi:phosphatidylglycerophosphate synthase
MIRITLWFVTLLRVVLIPVFVHLAGRAQELGSLGLESDRERTAALVVLLVMGASDLLDGWMARRFDLVSQVGAVVDMVADKLVQVALAAFFALSVGPVFQTLPFWFLVVVFGRDLVLLVGVLMLRARYGPLRVIHRWHGRMASSLVFLCLFWVAFGLPAGALSPLLVITTLLTLASATVYAFEGNEQGRRMAELSA